MRKTVTALVALLVTASAGQAQQMKASNPATSGIESMYSMVKGHIIKSAEMVPEEKYSFRPSKDVRTFGELVGHIVDAQAVVCPSAKGQTVQYAPATEKLTSKAQLIARLKESFAMCDAIYAGTSDADLARPATPFGMQMTVSGALSLNASHDWEHYGNMVTYLRLMGMVPPSSQR